MAVDVTIRIAGQAGQGIQSISAIMGKKSKRANGPDPLTTAGTTRKNRRTSRRHSEINRR